MATTFYVSSLVSERIKAQVDYYIDLGDDAAADKLAAYLEAAVDAIVAQPERGAPVAQMPATHRRRRFPPYHLYYRMNRDRDDVIIYWIKADGERKSYGPSSLERLATAAAKERMKE